MNCPRLLHIVTRYMKWIDHRKTCYWWHSKTRVAHYISEHVTKQIIYHSNRIPRSYLLKMYQKIGAENPHLCRPFCYNQMLLCIIEDWLCAKVICASWNFEELLVIRELITMVMMDYIFCSSFYGRTIFGDYSIWWSHVGFQVACLQFDFIGFTNTCKSKIVFMLSKYTLDNFLLWHFIFVK